MDPLPLLIFAGLLSLSAAFSGTETAITAISAVSIARMAEQGSRRARLLKKITESKGRVIAALLVGNNIVNVILAVYATLVFEGMMRGGTTLPHWAGPIIASVGSVVFLLIFGEVLPKTIAVTFHQRVALNAAYPLFVLMKVLSPVITALTMLSNAVMVLLGRKPGQDNIFDVHELHTLADLGEKAGAIDPQEKELIQRSSLLNETRVREIMIPRTDIQGIEVGATVDEIRAFYRTQPFTRTPVYRGDLDDIVGVLNFKEFLRHDPGRQRGFDVLAYLHKPLFVPGTMVVGGLLNEMRRLRAHMAIVLDEYGGTSGLITLEDIVERLVGRIDDEYDDEERPFDKVDERTWVVDGRITDELLVSQLGLTMPPEALDGFDTVAGLALKAFGNIPAEGDVTTYHGLELKVLQVRGHRVRRVQVKVPLPGEVTPEGDAKTSTRRKTQRVKPAELAGENAGENADDNGDQGDSKKVPAERDDEGDEGDEGDGTPRDEPLK